jgi:hypothetical protein
MAWFLRSLVDGDTHLGNYSTVTRSVHSLCGLEFVPVKTGLHCESIALAGNPLDPNQVCPDCRDKGKQR